MKAWMKAALLSVCLLALMTATAFAENVARIGSRIGSNEYPSIQAAVNAAKDGDTIYIIADHTIVADDDKYQRTEDDFGVLILMDKKKKVTIDFNGKDVSVKLDKDQDFCYGVIWLEGEAALTLKDSVGGGSLVVDAYAYDPDESFTTKGAIYAIVQNYGSGELIIESGHYELNKGGKGRGMITSRYSDTITVRGGTFYLGNVGQLANDSPWIFNANRNNERHINVSGGTFNFDILHQHNPFEVNAPQNKALRDNGDGTWTMVDAPVYIAEQEWSSFWYQHDVGYVSLKEAVKAAKKSNVYNKTNISPRFVIHLLENCAISDTLVIDKDLLLDQNGFTILWEGGDNKPILKVTENAILELMDVAMSGKVTDRYTYTYKPVMDMIKPIRAGYEFHGWYTDENMTDESKYTYQPSDADVESADAGGIRDVSLYAKWEPDLFDITWMNDGTPYHTTTEHKFDTKLALPEGQPTKEPSGGYRYEFIGWFTAPDGGEQILDGQIYKTPEHATYYARYNAIALPQDELPQTGDNSNMMLYALLLGAAVIGLGWTARKARA